jgi:hypothetical protein
VTQIHGSGAGNWVNTAMVDDQGRLWVNAAVTGSITAVATTDTYIQRIDYSGGMVPVYIGLANPGTATNVAGWQIKQLSYNDSMLVSGILFASGNTNFDKHWDNRYDGPYS